MNNNPSFLTLPILSRDFYERETVTVAKDLLGTYIIRHYNDQLLIGMINETEAYGGDEDPASHAYKKVTIRNKPMYGPVGYAYVYFIYGNHYCFNVVARSPDQQAGAVLIRSIIPLQGIEEMQTLRNKQTNHHLTNGPGKLCQALALTKQHNARELTHANGIYIVSRATFYNPESILSTARIGISKAQDMHWRFVLKNAL